MALSVAFRPPGEGVNPQKVPGGYFTGLVELTADAAYVQGGYAFGIAQMQTLTGGAAILIEAVDVVNHWGTTAGGAGLNAFLAFYARGTGKVLAYGDNGVAGAGSALQEAATNSASLSGLTCTLRVWYR